MPLHLLCRQPGYDRGDTAECLRTIPPRENGGNMDVQQMQVGTRITFPCFVDGCGLFAGDVHYAQGDGEVSGTAEMMFRCGTRNSSAAGRGDDDPARV